MDKIVDIIKKMTNQVYLFQVDLAWEKTRSAYEKTLSDAYKASAMLTDVDRLLSIAISVATMRIEEGPVFETFKSMAK